jgi:hypothetical protein
MAYVSTHRHHGLSSIEQVKSLKIIFDVSISENLEAILDFIGDDFKDAFTSGLFYFTSPIPLFSKFIEIDFSKLYAGAMSFPFVMRQIEPLTNIVVMEGLQTKISLMDAKGVFGAGWTTAISSYIMDFGRLGAILALFLQGFYTAYEWRNLRCKSDFNHVVILLILLVFATYIPLSSASAETNFFLMWLFCLGAIMFDKFRPFFRSPMNLFK